MGNVVSKPKRENDEGGMRNAHNAWITGITYAPRKLVRSLSEPLANAHGSLEKKILSGIFVTHDTVYPDYDGFAFADRPMLHPQITYAPRKLVRSLSEPLAIAHGSLEKKILSGNFVTHDTVYPDYDGFAFADRPMLHPQITYAPCKLVRSLSEPLANAHGSLEKKILSGNFVTHDTVYPDYDGFAFVDRPMLYPQITYTPRKLVRSLSEPLANAHGSLEKKILSGNFFTHDTVYPDYDGFAFADRPMLHPQITYPPRKLVRFLSGPLANEYGCLEKKILSGNFVTHDTVYPDYDGLPSPTDPCSTHSCILHGEFQRYSPRPIPLLRSMSMPLLMSPPMSMTML